MFVHVFVTTEQETTLHNELTSEKDVGKNCLFQASDDDLAGVEQKATELCEEGTVHAAADAGESRGRRRS